MTRVEHESNRDSSGAQWWWRWRGRRIYMGVSRIGEHRVVDEAILLVGPLTWRLSRRIFGIDTPWGGMWVAR